MERKGSFSLKQVQGYCMRYSLSRFQPSSSTRQMEIIHQECTQNSYGEEISTFNSIRLHQQTNYLLELLPGLMVQYYQYMEQVELTKEQFIKSSHKSVTWISVANRFHVKNVLLGSGFQTKVYACWDSKRLDVCAAKIICPLQKFQPTTQKTISAKDKESLYLIVKSEVEILLKLSHPNIIRFYDHHEKNTSLFLFYEYCHQGYTSDLLRTLQEYIKSTRDLTFEALLLLMRKITKACSYLHKQGVIHRNLTPSSILIAGGEPKISGFRHAINYSPFDPDLDPSDYPWGEQPQYIAPQVHLKNRMNAKCDCWSLGVTFYRIFCGRMPWKKGEKQWWQVTRAPLEFPPEAQLPKYIKENLKKMLQYDLTKRPSMDLISDYFNF